LSLLEELQRARTEEDVKDAYIKAMGLKGVRKGLVAIENSPISTRSSRPTPRSPTSCARWSTN
jgi:hypothetical protein